jgi:hypothetical protein
MTNSRGEQGWSLRGAIFAGALAATAINLVLGTYRLDYPINQSHQLPVVLWHWNPEPFANDAFVATLLQAPHFFWSFLAFVLTPETLDAGLFAFFLLFKAIFFGGVGALAAGLAPRRRWLAAIAAQTLFLGGPPPAPRRRAVTNWDYLTHTQAAQALCVACVAAAVWGRWLVASICLALATLAHPIFGVFGWVFFAPTALLLRQRGESRLRPRWLAERFALPALALAPMLRAAWKRAGAPLPDGWTEWIYENYAVHHAPHRDDVAAWAFPIILALAAAWFAYRAAKTRTRAPGGERFVVARRGRRGLFGMWLVGFVGVVWLRAPFLSQPSAVPRARDRVAAPRRGDGVGRGRRRALRRGELARSGPLVFWGAFFVAGCFDLRWDRVVAGDGRGVGGERGAFADPKPIRGRSARPPRAPLWRVVVARRLRRRHLRLQRAARLGRAAGADPRPARDCCRSPSRWRGERASPLPRLAVRAWFGPFRRGRDRPSSGGGHLLLIKASNERAAGRVGTHAPAMRDIGAWIRANAPLDAKLAAPWGTELAFPESMSLRGLRVAAWRTCLFAEMDESGAYYDPSYLPEARRLQGELGFGPSEAFLRGQSLDWLRAAERGGATLLVLPDFAPMLQAVEREGGGWRRVYGNGAYAALTKSAAPERER